ncbi:MAG TPA: glycoside hydrolase family 31 protein, partial [Verrucomicrobiae bacterium]|nr:glycoside hydrolase family 31 protein [Verrucomicrobiae bacterium]
MTLFSSVASGGAPAMGWSSLGAMSLPNWDGKTLLYRSAQGTLAVTPLSDDVVRVRFTRGQDFGRDLSYAVVNRDFGSPTVKADIQPEVTTLTTVSLKVVIRQSPLRISFANAKGDILDSDDPLRGMSFAGSEFRIAKKLANDEHVYGFGEKTGRLDKRGWQLGGYNYVMWNSDTPSYDSSTDPLYVAIPFFMVTRGGAAHGIFLDNTWRSFFDVGREDQHLLTFGADGGDLDYYFINGPDPKKVIERYTALTGRMPLPPLWSLGYQQCRWSYYPESRVRLLADTFRQKQVPSDGIWLDIHYLQDYVPFTWNHERFPNPKKMLSDLRAQGFHVVTILDGHPPALKGYKPYDEGIAGNYFVKNPDGSVFEGPVWPSNAGNHPMSVFPDFSNPATRKWWGGLYKNLLDDGVAGIWNDMNEPSVFNTLNGTMPDDIVFNNEGQPATSLQMHNTFGQLMSRATFEGLSHLQPDKRAFVLTRSTFAGGQRYSALWTGDSATDWPALRQSVSMLLGLGISGYPFVGADIGGFGQMPSAELLTRWLQTAVFYPFMRMHTPIDTPDKEPWSFGWKYEAVNKRAIELRYELLPYIYNIMQQASETGVPALRPLFLDFPDDPQTAKTDDEFMFGSDLLVAPVLWEGAQSRGVYLPAGDWYDYWTGQHFSGPATFSADVTLDSIPIYVRGGGFIFRQPVVQNTGLMPGNPLRVLIAPGTSGSSLYEDDGESLKYRHGDFMRREFHQISSPGQRIFEVSAPEGSWRPAKRDLILETWTDRAPSVVSEQTGA